FAASDDGVGVAVLLEVARALTAQARPINDIVFVVTDAEESCLCGAEAFARDDPAAADGGVLLNFDDRGAGGPGIMFRTSPGNSALIAAYQDAVPYPWASSFAVEVNRRLPGDTDFSPLMKSGKFTGLDTAHIDGSAIYHTPQDRPEYVDHGSIQHTGANALALTRALAATDLAPLRDSSGPEATYFPALSVLISYPAWLVWPLAGLSVAAVAGLAWLARRRNLTSWPRLAAGFALTLLPLLLGPAISQLLWITLVAIRPGYANMLDPWWPGWFRACSAALVMVIVLAWYGLFRRRIGPWGLLIAGIGVLAVLGVALAVLAPNGSYLVALPGLAGAVCCIIAILSRRPVLQLIAQVAGASMGIVILVPTVLALFAAVGLTRAAVPGFVVVLLALSILPVLEWVYPVTSRERAVDGPTVRSAGRRRWWAAAPALLAAVLAGTFLVTGLAVDHFDAAHPAPVQLNYIQDADTGQARWFSSDENPDPWVAHYVTGQPNNHAEFWLLDDGVPTGPAPAAHLPAPTVTALADSVSDGRRTLTVSVVPQRTSDRLWLTLPDTLPIRVTVAGREVPLADEDNFFLAFYGSPATGITVTFELSGAAPIRLLVGDNSQGLDGVPGYVARPDGLGVVGADGSDMVTVGRTYTL
ncbi:MAG: M28 family peptidase, partial [Nakamurella sp.]